MAQQNLNVLGWNPRGLNNILRRDAVRDLARDTHASIVCLQETKLDFVDDAIISAMLGPSFTANYAVLPAIGTRGGMILAVSDAFFTLSVEGTPWSITCVYGPQDEHEKRDFIDELRTLKTVVRSAWLLLGDFNLITKASDKNNFNINRRLIDKFRAARDFLELKEMRIDGRRFTWSNAQDDPVLTKIDHVFFSDDWNMLLCSSLMLTSKPSLRLAQTTRPSFYKDWSTPQENLPSNSRNFGCAWRDLKRRSRRRGTSSFKPQTPSVGSTSSSPGRQRLSRNGKGRALGT
jgi:hypothetical protein